MPENKIIRIKLNKYIFSSMLAMLGISCYVIADTFFISVVAGTDGITALNLTLPIYAMMYALGSMIGIGSATRFSIEKAGKVEGYDDYFGNAVFWSLLISIFFIMTGLCAPHRVLLVMGANEVILKTGLSYLRIALLFAPAFMLNYTMTAFVRNDNKPNIAMIATLSSNAFNIVFDFIFMFPMNMGMKGAALATGLSPVISMGVCLIHFLSDKNTIHLKKVLPDIKKFLKACSLGISGFVGEISNGVIALTFNLMMLKIVGNIGVAAYGVIANISLVAIAIFSGVAQGLQPMASEASGTGNRNMQKEVCRYSLQIGIIVSVILLLICWFFSKDIVAIFNSEGSFEMADYAVNGLRLYSIGFILAVVNIVRAGYYGAIGKAFECAVISLLRGIFAIVVFVVVLPEFMGINGVWLAFPASELFTFIVSVIMHLIGQNNKPGHKKGENNNSKKLPECGYNNINV